MNYINNGEYYLIAQYPNKKSEVITLKKGWYMGDKDETEQQRVDISSIDLITTQFKNEQQMKERMLKNGYIEDMSADIYIVHYHKNEGKEYIKQYEVLYNESERTNIIKPLARKRLNNEKITKLDTDDIYNKLITKSFSKYSFYKFMTCPWSNVDAWIKEKLIDQRNKQKKDYSIKYWTKDNYTVVRNIISMWNLYDSLVQKYIENNKSYTEEQLANGIIELYNKKLNQTDLRKECIEKLKPVIDRKNVPGQINMEEYLNNKKAESDDSILIKKGNNFYDASYNNKMNQLYEEEKQLHNSPFDDLTIGNIVKEHDIEYVVTKIDRDYLNNLSLEDKYRLGLISTYVEYKRLKRSEDGKRYS